MAEYATIEDNDEIGEEATAFAAWQLNALTDLFSQTTDINGWLYPGYIQQGGRLQLEGRYNVRSVIGFDALLQEANDIL